MDEAEKPLILILVKRAAIFLFVLCAISTFYWIVGSLSSFLDETQSMLLSIMRISALGIVSVSGLGIAVAAVLARRYRLSLGGVVAYALAAAFGASALAVAQAVSILSLGLR